MRSVIAQITPTSAAAGSAVIVLVRFGAGFLGGGVIGWILRFRFSQWHAASGVFRGGAFISEKVVVLTVGIIAGVFELWKSASFQTTDRLVLTMYAITGFLSALAIAIPLLISHAKEKDKETIGNLSTEKTEAIAQRDTSLEAIGAIGAVIEAKKQRFAAANVTNAAEAMAALCDALGPKVQARVIIKSLHQQFARHISAPGRLRVGIYMRSPESPQTLAPLYSWNGENENCFSNSHPGYMSLDAPGGAQSLVVQCYRSQSPLLMVENCEKDPNFIFFTANQRGHLKSMAAYRYNLLHSGRPDALILTMDTNVAGFFSPSRGFACRLLLEETGRRLELELISLDLIKKLN